IVDKQRARYIKAIESFSSLYGQGREVSLYSAPGRTEIGGNHTDHNMGIVVAAAVNIDVLCVVSKTDDDKINLFSQGFKAIEQVDCKDLEVRTEQYNTTESIIRGVCAGIKQRGGECGGFCAYVTSDVLQGSGLSSSAAFEVAVGTIINHEFCHGRFNGVEIAQIGQYAENVYFGKPSGLMDQTASSVGSLMTIDFKDNSKPVVTPITFDLDKYNLALCVINSGGSHADLTDDYSAIKYEMCSVANSLGKDFLGDLNPDEFFKAIPQIREKVGDRAILRAIHFYMECERATSIRNAIEKEDVEGFLSKIIEGGHSSFEYNQNAHNGKDESYQPVSLALCMAQNLLQGKRGAWRLQGGGFAGTIQCFVDKDILEDFVDKMEKV
ncbi:MAG: galactokinase family protein, partial [Oscillospiraceae bacterium]